MKGKNKLCILLIISFLIFNLNSVFANDIATSSNVKRSNGTEISLFSTNDAGDESFVPDIPSDIATSSDATNPDEDIEISTPSEVEDEDNDKFKVATPSDADKVATPSDAQKPEITVITIDIINTHIPDEKPIEDKPVATPFVPDKPINGGWNGTNDTNDETKTPVHYVPAEEDKIGKIDAYYDKDYDKTVPDEVFNPNTGHWEKTDNIKYPDDIKIDKETNFPKTGDNINNIIYLFGLSGIGITIIWFIKKKRL